MTNEAFVYYLPRFLIEALEYYDDPLSAIPEDLIYQLTKKAGDVTFDDKLRLLTDAQRRAIAKGLLSLGSLARSEDSYLVDRVEEALASAWSPFVRDP